jgi:CRISPR locus-related DNA-binding protein
MKLHIATLGLHANERVDYVLMKCGGDKLALVYTEKNSDELKEITARMKRAGIPVIAKRVDPWGYHKILNGILEIVLEHSEYEIEFNISCGTRVMTSAAQMAALFIDSTVYFVTEKDGDVMGEIAQVEPISVSMLTEPKKNILSELVDLGGSVDSQKKLGTRTSLRASSISKHLKELERAGYISRELHNRQKSVEITGLGRTVLQLKRVRKMLLWGE